MGDMDSGNSGSMQSSSTGGGVDGGGGDDQEYDSRHGGGGESIPAFFNPLSSFNTNHMGAATPAPAPAPLHLYSFSNGLSSFAHQQLVSNYYDHPLPTTLSQSSSLECPNFMIDHSSTAATSNNTNDIKNGNSNNNQLDMVWPNKFASIRPSDYANCTQGPLGYSNPPRPLPLQLPIPIPGPPAPLPSPRSSTAPTNSGSGRNPKKRSRASRRAPTTVLTTDTNNFRQMVQEFTGIPAPPFTAFSTRARFDLLGGLGVHSNCTVPPPSYLLRPFSQKIPPLHQPPFLFNSPLPPHTSNTTDAITNSDSSALVDGLRFASAPASSASMSVSTNIVASLSTTFHLCDPQEFPGTNPQLTFQSLLPPTSSALAVQHGSKMSLGCTTATPHQTSCPVDPAGGNYRGTGTTTAAVDAANGVSDNNNNGGATKGEGVGRGGFCHEDSEAVLGNGRSNSSRVSGRRWPGEAANTSYPRSHGPLFILFALCFASSHFFYFNKLVTPIIVFTENSLHK